MNKLAILLFSCAVLSSADDVKRPRILGVAHMALYVSDLGKARAFYKDFLGYDEPYSLKRKDGAADRIAFIKINEQQYLELFAEEPQHNDGQLNHISFYTDNAKAVREKGKFLPDTRISTHMAHLGVLIAELEPAIKFYRDVLGFQEFWRGGGNPKQLSWVNMRVPD